VAPPRSSESKKILKHLRSLGSPKVAKGMVRFGINSKKAYGVAIPDLRRTAKDIRNRVDDASLRHAITLDLWVSGVHEARILASMIDDPGHVTDEQMEKWVHDFDSWDVCDQCCGNLFDKTTVSIKKAFEWSSSKTEFIKRAGFVLMATMAVHRKEMPDSVFKKFFPIIIAHSDDNRNFVRKGVNWALRQIGKRNAYLKKKAITAAKTIRKRNSPAAKWIAADALRELT
jgi:3-methyladenine DNA glycosylase AlkD